MKNLQVEMDSQLPKNNVTNQPLVEAVVHDVTPQTPLWICRILHTLFKLLLCMDITLLLIFC